MGLSTKSYAENQVIRVARTGRIGVQKQHTTITYRSIGKRAVEKGSHVDLSQGFTIESGT